MTLPDLPQLDSLWDYDHPDASEARFRAVLRQARAANNAPYEAEALTQLARSQGLQGRFDEAHRTLDAAADLIDDAMPTAKVRCLLERGRVFNTAGTPEVARDFFEQALDLATSSGEDGFAVDALHMLAIVSPPEGKIEWNLRGLEVARASDQPRAQRWRGSLLNNLAWTYHDLGRYDDALALFEEALEWRREQNQAPETRIATWSVGRALRSLGRYDEAFALQRALKEEILAAGTHDGYVNEEIGECLLALGREAEAHHHFREAYNVLSRDRWLSAHEPDRLARLRDLGEIDSLSLPEAQSST
jgi:tetratricopeptide (TPR) repeat protein